MDTQDDYIVLVNEQEQHGLWPSFKDIPEGWTQVGPTGSKEDCAAWVDENWTDVTPLNARVATQ